MSYLDQSEEKKKDYMFGFENLNIFKECRIYVRKIYNLTKRLPKEELFGLSSQMKRAAASVSANFVEGNHRFSDKEKMHFYEIAYGSLMEVYCHVLTAMDVGYEIYENDFYEIKEHTRSIGSMLSGMRNACMGRIVEAETKRKG